MRNGAEPYQALRVQLTANRRRRELSRRRLIGLAAAAACLPALGLNTALAADDVWYQNFRETTLYASAKSGAKKVIKIPQWTYLKAVGAQDGGATADARIVPGERVGPVRLGTTRDVVLKRLGKPAESGSAGGYREDRFRWSPAGAAGGRPKEPTLVVVSRAGRVVQVSVSHPACRTREGVSPASTFAAIRQRYPRLTVRDYGMIDPAGGGYVLIVFDDVKRGLAFTPGTQDDEGTYLTLPESAPLEVVVHRPGTPAVPLDAGMGVVGERSRPYPDSAMPRIQAYMNGAPHKKPRR